MYKYNFFTKTVDNTEDLINSNLFYPRILIATAGSIGVGLDSVDVYSVVRVGFPTSILEMVQEMDRCGHDRQNENGIVTDQFRLLLSCQDCVYLNQLLYLSQTPLLDTVKATLTVEEDITVQHNNLLSLLKISVLKGTCRNIN